MKPIVLLGCPRDYGGANREAADVASLWQTSGIPVTIIPLAKEHPGNPWPIRLAEIGCKIEQPAAIFNLHDSIVIDFCAERACRFWPELKRRGCNLVHVPCQCTILPHEEAAFHQWPPSVVVCQTGFQKYVIQRDYLCYGVSDIRIIRGAFDEEWFPYRIYPKTNGTFTVGVIGRNDPRKWPDRILSILKAAKKRIPKLRARFLGWSPSLSQGKLPPWIHHHPEGSIPAAKFLEECHALLAVSGYMENWSRVVLEAFSTGVPVIADGRGGYIEQVRDCETGFLIDSERDAVEALALLDSDDSLRVQVSRQAKRHLPELCCGERILADWRKLFTSLGNSP